MLKQLVLNNRQLSIEWKPEIVGRYLDEEGITANDLVQPDKAETQRLCKDLFLLAARAAISDQPCIHAYAVVLRQVARHLSALKPTQQQHGRRQTMQEDRKHVKELPSLDNLQAQLFRVLTQYSVRPCHDVATHIVQSLTHLCEHPLIELVPEQRSIYSQSLNMWRSRLLNPQISHRFH